MGALRIAIVLSLTAGLAACGGGDNTATSVAGGDAADAKAGHVSLQFDNEHWENNSVEDACLGADDASKGRSATLTFNFDAEKSVQMSVDLPASGNGAGTITSVLAGAGGDRIFTGKDGHLQISQQRDVADGFVLSGSFDANLGSGFGGNVGEKARITDGSFADVHCLVIGKALRAIAP